MTLIQIYILMFSKNSTPIQLYLFFLASNVWVHNIKTCVIYDE